MVARLVRDQEARGSNPPTPTTKKRYANAGRFFVLREEDCSSGTLAEPSAAWFGKSGLPPPGADAGSLLLPQRSKNRRKSASPNGFSLTARRREAKRPGVQILALRPLLEGKDIVFYPLLAYFGNFFGNVIFWPCAKGNKKGKQFSEKGIFLPSTGHEKAAPFGAAVVGVLIIFSFLSGMRSRSFSKALRRHVR